jgi:AcrR family transcriptional regulator
MQGGTANMLPEAKFSVKADQHRDALLDSLANHVLAHGLAASSLRALAAAAGTSDRMLLYYFADKSELMVAVLERIGARLLGELESRGSITPLPLIPLRRRLIALLGADDLWPYMQLWLEIVAQAARGDTFAQLVGERMGQGFLLWGSAQLDCSSAEDRDAQAAELFAAIDGAMLLKAVGMRDVVARLS